MSRPDAPRCGLCGAEKFTIPGSGLGWLCGCCDRKSSGCTHKPAPGIAATIAPDGAVTQTPAASEAPAKPSRVGRIATMPEGLPGHVFALRVWAQASGLSARYFGSPVYLVGGALRDDDPRDIDLVVAMPDDLFVCSYGDHPWRIGAVHDELDAWESSKGDVNPAPVWRRWARDCAKQSRALTLAVGRAVDFKTQPLRSFAAHDFKPRVRLDCAFMPAEATAADGGAP